MTKNIYLFVGPSGSGKTTIVDYLAELGFRRVKSYTTRPPRFEGEDNYNFITEAEWLDIEDQIITGTKYHGHHYGATAAQMDEAEIYILEPKGVHAVLEKYSKTRPVVVIGLTAPMSVLEERMQARGDDADAIRWRLEGDYTLFGCMNDFCDVVFRNSDKEDILDVIAAIIEYMRFREKQAEPT